MPDSPPVLPDAILTPGAASPAGDGGVVAQSPDRGLPSGQLVRSGGVSDSPALSKKSRDTALIAQRDAKVRRQAARVELANGLACFIDDAGNPLPGVPVDPATGRPKGWTAVQHQIAKDSRRPIKVQPGYIAQQLRVAESYRKAEAETSKPAPVLNATQVVVHQEFHYPTIKVER